MINLLVGNFDKKKFKQGLDAAFDAIRSTYPRDPNCPLTGDRYIEYTHLIRYYLMQFAKDCTFNGTNMFDVEREESVPVRTTQEEYDELKAIESELDRLYAPDVTRLKHLWVRLVTMDMFAEKDERVMNVVHEVEQRILYGSIFYANTKLWVLASPPSDRDELIVRAEAIRQSEKAEDGIGICVERQIRRDAGVNVLIACAYNRRTKKEVSKTVTAPNETCLAVQHALVTLLRNEVA